MAESKSRLLYILKYLWQNTDAEHYATTADILAFLKGNGISCDRKTIPGDIAKLCDIGIDIEEERSRENRYSLSSHLFTLPELKLLIDAVESSKFITVKKSAELIEKLSEDSGFTEDYIREQDESSAHKGWFANAFSGRSLNGVSNQDYLWIIQRSIILELAARESCVIVGRCADYILKDAADCLKVFIHAGFDKRAQRIVSLY